MSEEIEEITLEGLDLPEATTLVQKLWYIQRAVNGLQKNKKSHSYDYTTGDKILAHIKPLMNHYGVLLEMHITDIENTVTVYKTGTGQYEKNKTEMYTALKFDMVWVCAHTGDERHVRWGANGMNDWEKGFGSALTYGERYFFLKYFHIATDKDDVDNADRKQDGQYSQEKPATNLPSQRPAPIAKAKTAPVEKAKAIPPAEKAKPAETKATPPVEKAKATETKAPEPKKDDSATPPVDSAADQTRKAKAKEAFALLDQGKVLLFLVEEKKCTQATVNDWIDSVDIATALKAYGEFKAQ